MAETTLKKNANGYGYKYTDLAEIHNYIESIGKRYYQYTETVVVGENAFDYIHTVIQTKDKDGNFVDERDVRGARVVNAELAGKTNSAQEQGSGLTYCRRYSLLLAFGLATDDDDAETLTRAKTTTKATTKQGSDKIDFAEVRENLKNADSLEELKEIAGAIPEPLKKYFVKDYEKAKEVLEFREG